MNKQVHDIPRLDLRVPHPHRGPELQCHAYPIALACMVPNRIRLRDFGPHWHAWGPTNLSRSRTELSCTRTAFACVVAERVGVHGHGPHCHDLGSHSNPRAILL